MKTKKSKLTIAVILAVLAAAFVYMETREYIEKRDATFEDKILECMNFDTAFGGEIDRIDFITEALGGYIGVGSSTKDGLLNFVYIEDDGGSLALSGKTTVSAEVFIYNDDFETAKRVKIANRYSESHIYFNCYPHKDGLVPYVDGTKVTVYNFDITFGKKTYNMDFWFTKSENPPTVTTQNTAEQNLTQALT